MHGWLQCTTWSHATCIMQVALESDAFARTRRCPSSSGSSGFSEQGTTTVLTMCQDERVRRRRISGVAEEHKKLIAVDKLASDISEPIGYTLTRRVVSFHKHANDGWVIYNGGVYDVTVFLEGHPGGADVITEHLGGDITDVFHDGMHSHSSYASKVLAKYRIGTLSDSTNKFRNAEGEVVSVEEDNMEGLVDWNKPILHQVGMLGTQYTRWIHSFPTTDHTVKMFTNPTLESLTKCAWYVPLLVWIPVILGESLHYSMLMGGVGNLSPVVILGMSLLGYVFWLWFEYALHRWIFHWESSSYWGNIVHFLIHGHHHITPMDLDRLVFPPIPALLLGWPFWLGAPRVLGVEKGYPWLIGFAVGYLIYDMTHFWIHQGIPASKVFKQQKRRHVHHHYFQPNVNFGISNPLFDYVLGTIKEPAQ